MIRMVCFEFQKQQKLQKKMQNQEWLFTEFFCFCFPNNKCSLLTVDIKRRRQITFFLFLFSSFFSVVFFFKPKILQKSVIALFQYVYMSLYVKKKQRL